MNTTTPLTKEEVAEVLSYIPRCPGYEIWVRMIAAVGSVLPPEQAIEVLQDHSPEVKPGEYRAKLRSPLKGVGIATLIWMAKAHGFDARAFYRQRVTGCPARPHPPKVAPRPAVQTAAPTKMPPRFKARLGALAELNALATLRHLPSVAGLAEMQAAGCLEFTDHLSDVDDHGNWATTKAWLVTDASRRNVSARRLDGQPWRCIQDEKSRCVSGAGSKHWPLGLNLAKPGQRLDVVEGEGDLVALWHIHAVAGVVDAAPIALLGTCGSFDGLAPQEQQQVAGSTVQIFAHRDASGAGQRAALKWASSLYRLGAQAVVLKDLGPWLGGSGKDLNDALVNQFASADARQRPEEVARKLLGCGAGSDCTILPKAA